MQSGVSVPETYVATLKSGIARSVSGKSTGILLNFCSPDYARKLVQDISTRNNHQKLDYACYLKVFYSRDKAAADRLLIEEFAKYDSIGPYHKMFEKDKVAMDINIAKESLKGERPTVPASLLAISPSNPSENELRDYVDGFRKAGITLPCVYPYFSNSDDLSFREQTIRQIASSI